MTPHLSPGLSLLLVEDDDELAVIMSRWATWVGASMDTTALGRTGLALAAANRYDAVLLDLTLPDMEGSAMYESLVRLRPGLASRIILLTGGAGDEASDAFLHQARCPVLLKPFDLDVLARQIARLDSAAA